MRSRVFAGCLLAAVMGCAALQGMAQQDEGPILRPRVSPKPVAKPAAGATLLVICDLACNWKLDGKAQGRIVAGDSTTAKVDLGEHLVVAVTEDGLDKVQQLTEVKAAGQKVVNFELQPVRDARRNAWQQATRDKAERETAENRAIGADRLQQPRGDPADWAREGRALFDQNRYAEAKPFFERACASDEMSGCTNLGLLYNKGQGVIQDYAQARWFYQKACNGGEIYGCDNLGVLFQRGDGVSEDYARARMFYQKACNGGNKGGCDHLLLLQDSPGKAADWARAGRALFDQNRFEEAKPFFEKACDGGEMSGCTNLGLLYNNGLGQTKDYVEARRLYQKACDGGEVYGCDNLGVLYQKGQGVSESFVRARVLYQKACNGGNNGGCEHLRTLP